ncbi:MAG: TrkH family potassium uptake protein [Haloarculaceae archaeon]
MVRAPSTYVDYRVSAAFVGAVLKYIGVTPLFPLVLALSYGEDPVPFLATSVVMLGGGALLERLRGDGELGNREAFLLVSLAWLVVPLAGTIPYLVAGTGTVANPVDAMFESMSGFTTTGATVLGEISTERHGHAMLMWRQLTQWLGGMGILVLMVAILPELSVGGAQVIDQEAPGLSLEKLTPRIQETARVLWGIYAGFTVLAAVVYYGLHLGGVAPNMDLYNAVAHALTTMPTGGFSPEARSVEAFAPAVQWTVMPFMLVAGTNFALFWYVLQGSPRRLTDNTEFRAYLLAVACFGAVISAVLFLDVGLIEAPANVDVVPGSVENALRQGLFQVIAIVTTTGYASMDVNTWDPAAQTILLFAYFLGGSAGSAAGSVKIVRWVLVERAIVRSLFTSVHPEAVRPVRFGGDAVDEGTVRDVFVFVMLFVLLFVLSTILLYLDSLRTPDVTLSGLEAMSVAIATLGNVGPGFGVVGPMNSFLPFSDAAKLYMVFLMWIGRLEIISVLVVLTPSFWER